MRLRLKWLGRSKNKAEQKVIPSAPHAVGFQDLFGSAAQGQAPAKGHVVLVGNCLAEGLQMRMSPVSAATRLYDFSVIPLHLKSIEDVLSKHDLARATHVISHRFHAVDLNRLRELISPEAQIIEYRDVVFRSAWPFEGANGFKDEAMSKNPESPIIHPDGALAMLRTLEPDKKKRIQRYRDLDFELASGVDRIIETQERFLESIDNSPDFRLAQSILNNYKSIQLFYNSVHPSGALFQYYCEDVWGKLGLKGPAPSFGNVDHWRKWSLPVHPVIARRLGLKWADEKTSYRYGALGKVTWREWVEAYVEAFG